LPCRQQVRNKSARSWQLPHLRGSYRETCLKPCPHCRRKVRLAENDEFGDSRTFLRQCGQTVMDLGHNARRCDLNCTKGQRSEFNGQDTTAAAEGVELTSDVIICGWCKRSFVDGSHLVLHKQSGTCRQPITACTCRRHDNVTDNSHVTGE